MSIIMCIWPYDSLLLLSYNLIWHWYLLLLYFSLWLNRTHKLRLGGMQVCAFLLCFQNWDRYLWERVDGLPQTWSVCCRVVCSQRTMTVTMYHLNLGVFFLLQFSSGSLISYRHLVCDNHSTDLDRVWPKHMALSQGAPAVGLHRIPICRRDNN